MQFSIGSDIPVLLYHRVVTDTSEVGKHKIWVLERKFKQQMAYLHKAGFQTLTFADLDRLSEMDPLQPKVIITFDDGYEDNYLKMFPILKEFGQKAVIYLVTQFKRNEWGIVEGEPAKPLMNAEQIQEMVEYGIEFGGHTQHHKTLTEISVEDAVNEIAGCKRDVEAVTGKEALSFSFPFGALNEVLKRKVEDAGYRYSVATNTGAKNWKLDHFQIRRIEISPKTSLRSFKRKVNGDYFTRKTFLSLFSSSR